MKSSTASENDDEVLVAFQHGDFAHPYIVGFLWNGNDKPPESDPKKRLLVTPGNHRLLFDDGNPKKIELTAASGYQLLLDDQQVQVTVGASKVTIRESSITLEGGLRKLSLAEGKVQIL